VVHRAWSGHWSGGLAACSVEMVATRWVEVVAVEASTSGSSDVGLECSAAVPKIESKALVMLKSAKDRVLGVDTPGQQVPPRAWYGTICLLIMDAVGSVPCSDEWEIGIVTHLGSHGARGVVVPLLE
jgi:hypothetical protein